MDSSNGIYPPYEVFYIECIKTSSLNAISSWEKLNRIVSNAVLLNNQAINTVDLAENIINQAGVISKFFFPPRTNGQNNLIHKLRGEKLRQAFNIDDTHVLKDRSLRNYIEHFDENLDLFLNRPVAGTIIPPKAVYWNSDDIDEVTVVFKAYIINEFKFISLSKEMLLIPLIKEIYDVYNNCIKFNDKGGKLK